MSIKPPGKRVFNKRSSILTKARDSVRFFSRYRGRKSISFPRIFLFSKIRNGVARKSMNDTTRDTLILVRRPITLRSRRSIRCTNASADSSFGYYLRGNRCRPIVNSSIPFHDGRSFFASRWKHDTCLSIDWNRG